MYATRIEGSKIIAYETDGRAIDVVKDFAGSDLVVAHNGNIYATKVSDGFRLWLIEPKGTKKLVDNISPWVAAVALSPDQTLLYAADQRSHWVYSYRIQTNGLLANRQPYYWLHTPENAEDARTGGLTVDHDGRLYAATRMGIQVCDQAGRVQCILPMPKGRLDYLCFGGEKFDTLFAACGDKILKRRLKVVGANAWSPPHRPAPPRL